MELKQESILLEHPAGHKLHLKRWYTKPEAKPVWLVHGSIENGRIFYSNSGKGFAPYLAQNGFDAYVMDLRGRGESVPPIDAGSDFGNYDVIEQDFPFFLDWLKEKKNGQKAHWIAHSWGGVLQLAFLARHNRVQEVDKIVFFGTKRKIDTFNLSRLIYIELFWNFVFSRMIKKHGYLPAELPGGMGSEKETLKSYEETKFWVDSPEWVDQRDGFDYSEALKKIDLPEALYLTGYSDKVLGNPRDVKRIINEAGHEKAIFEIIGKPSGFKKNYGHIDILTDKTAAEEVYSYVLDFLKK